MSQKNMLSSDVPLMGSSPSLLSPDRVRPPHTTPVSALLPAASSTPHPQGLTSSSVPDTLSNPTVKVVKKIVRRRVTKAEAELIRQRQQRDREAAAAALPPSNASISSTHVAVPQFGVDGVGDRRVGQHATSMMGTMHNANTHAPTHPNTVININTTGNSTTNPTARNTPSAVITHRSALATATATNVQTTPDTTIIRNHISGNVGHNSGTRSSGNRGSGIGAVANNFPNYLHSSSSLPLPSQLPSSAFLPTTSSSTPSHPSSHPQHSPLPLPHPLPPPLAYTRTPSRPAPSNLPPPSSFPSSSSSSLLPLPARLPPPQPHPSPLPLPLAPPSTHLTHTHTPSHDTRTHTHHTPITAQTPSISGISTEVDSAPSSILSSGGSSGIPAPLPIGNPFAATSMSMSKPLGALTQIPGNTIFSGNVKITENREEPGNSGSISPLRPTTGDPTVSQLGFSSKLLSQRPTFPKTTLSLLPLPGAPPNSHLPIPKPASLPTSASSTVTTSALAAAANNTANNSSSAASTAPAITTATTTYTPAITPAVTPTVTPAATTDAAALAASSTTLANTRYASTTPTLSVAPATNLTITGLPSTLPTSLCASAPASANTPVITHAPAYLTTSAPMPVPAPIPAAASAPTPAPLRAHGVSVRASGGYDDVTGVGVIDSGVGFADVVVSGACAGREGSAGGKPEPCASAGGRVRAMGELSAGREHAAERQGLEEWEGLEVQEEWEAWRSEGYGVRGEAGQGGGGVGTGKQDCIGRNTGNTGNRGHRGAAEAREGGRKETAWNMDEGDEHLSFPGEDDISFTSSEDPHIPQNEEITKSPGRSVFSLGMGASSVISGTSAAISEDVKGLWLSATDDITPTTLAAPQARNADNTSHVASAHARTAHAHDTITGHMNSAQVDRNASYMAYATVPAGLSGVDVADGGAGANAGAGAAVNSGGIVSNIPTHTSSFTSLISSSSSTLPSSSSIFATNSPSVHTSPSGIRKNIEIPKISEAVMDDDVDVPSPLFGDNPFSDILDVNMAANVGLVPAIDVMTVPTGSTARCVNVPPAVHNAAHVKMSSNVPSNVRFNAPIASTGVVALRGGVPSPVFGPTQHLSGNNVDMFLDMDMSSASGMPSSSVAPFIDTNRVGVTCEVDRVAPSPAAPFMDNTDMQMSSDVCIDSPCFSKSRIMNTTGAAAALPSPLVDSRVDNGDAGAASEVYLSPSLFDSDQRNRVDAASDIDIPSPSSAGDGSDMWGWTMPMPAQDMPGHLQGSAVHTQDKATSCLSFTSTKPADAPHRDTQNADMHHRLRAQHTEPTVATTATTTTAAMVDPTSTAATDTDTIDAATPAPSASAVVDAGTTASTYASTSTFATATANININPIATTASPARTVAIVVHAAPPAGTANVGDRNRVSGDLTIINALPDSDDNLGSPVRGSHVNATSGVGTANTAVSSSLGARDTVTFAAAGIEDDDVYLTASGAHMSTHTIIAPVLRAPDDTVISVVGIGGSDISPDVRGNHVDVTTIDILTGHSYADNAPAVNTMHAHARANAAADRAAGSDLKWTNGCTPADIIDAVSDGHANAINGDDTAKTNTADVPNGTLTHSNTINDVRDNHVPAVPAHISAQCASTAHIDTTPALGVDRDGVVDANDCAKVVSAHVLDTTSSAAVGTEAITAVDCVRAGTGMSGGSDGSRENKPSRGNVAGAAGKAAEQGGTGESDGDDGGAVKPRQGRDDEQCPQMRSDDASGVSTGAVGVEDGVDVRADGGTKKQSASVHHAHSVTTKREANGAIMKAMTGSIGGVEMKEGEERGGALSSEDDCGGGRGGSGQGNSSDKGKKSKKIHVHGKKTSKNDASGKKNRVRDYGPPPYPHGYPYPYPYPYQYPYPPHVPLPPHAQNLENGVHSQNANNPESTPSSGYALPSFPGMHPNFPNTYGFPFPNYPPHPPHSFPLSMDYGVPVPPSHQHQHPSSWPAPSSSYALPQPPSHAVSTPQPSTQPSHARPQVYPQHQQQPYGHVQQHPHQDLVAAANTVSRKYISSRKHGNSGTSDIPMSVPVLSPTETHPSGIRKIPAVDPTIATRTLASVTAADATAGEATDTNTRSTAHTTTATTSTTSTNVTMKNMQPQLAFTPKQADTTRIASISQSKSSKLPRNIAGSPVGIPKFPEKVEFPKKWNSGGIFTDELNFQTNTTSFRRQKSDIYGGIVESVGLTGLLSSFSGKSGKSGKSENSNDPLLDISLSPLDVLLRAIFMGDACTVEQILTSNATAEEENPEKTLLPEDIPYLSGNSHFSEDFTLNIKQIPLRYYPEYQWQALLHSSTKLIRKIPIAKLALQHGADINKPDTRAKTSCLILAVQFGPRPVWRFLLSHDADIRHGSHMFNCVQQAVVRGNLEFIYDCYYRGIDVEVSEVAQLIEHADNTLLPDTPAWNSADSGNLPYSYEYVDSGYGTPLQFALAMGQYQTFLRLIAVGREQELGISISENSGYTPLHPGECPGGYESEDDTPDGVNPEFSSRATLSGKSFSHDKGRTPPVHLSETVLKSEDDFIPETAGLFIPAKYSRNNPPPFPAFNVNPTPLHRNRSLLHEVTCLPSFSLQTTLITSLIHAKAPINTQDDEGNTCLLLAVQNGHVAVCEVLLTHGANIWICNHEGMNALVACLLSPAARTDTSLFERLLVYAEEQRRQYTAYMSTIQRQYDTIHFVESITQRIQAIKQRIDVDIVVIRRFEGDIQRIEEEISVQSSKPGDYDADHTTSREYFCTLYNKLRTLENEGEKQRFLSSFDMLRQYHPLYNEYTTLCSESSYIEQQEAYFNGLDENIRQNILSGVNICDIAGEDGLSASSWAMLMSRDALPAEREVWLQIRALIAKYKASGDVLSREYLLQEKRKKEQERAAVARRQVEERRGEGEDVEALHAQKQLRKSAYDDNQEVDHEEDEDEDEYEAEEGEEDDEAYLYRYGRNDAGSATYEEDEDEYTEGDGVLLYRHQGAEYADNEDEEEEEEDNQRGLEEEEEEQERGGKKHGLRVIVNEEEEVPEPDEEVLERQMRRPFIISDEGEEEDLIEEEIG